LSKLKELREKTGIARFVAIGTSDLLQSILKEEGRHDFTKLHPRLVQGIAAVAQGAREKDITVTVDGEWANSPLLMYALISLDLFHGLKTIWVPQTTQLPAQLEFIRHTAREDLEKMLKGPIDAIVAGKELPSVEKFHNLAAAVHDAVKERAMGSREFKDFVSHQKTHRHISQEPHGARLAAHKSDFSAPWQVHRLISELGDRMVRLSFHVRKFAGSRAQEQFDEVIETAESIRNFVNAFRPESGTVFFWAEDDHLNLDMIGMSDDPIFEKIYHAQVPDVIDRGKLSKDADFRSVYLFFNRYLEPIEQSILKLEKGTDDAAISELVEKEDVFYNAYMEYMRGFVRRYREINGSAHHPFFADKRGFMKYYGVPRQAGARLALEGDEDNVFFTPEKVLQLKQRESQRPLGEQMDVIRRLNEKVFSEKDPDHTLVISGYVPLRKMIEDSFAGFAEQTLPDTDQAYIEFLRSDPSTKAARYRAAYRQVRHAINDLVLKDFFQRDLESLTQKHENIADLMEEVLKSGARLAQDDLRKKADLVASYTRLIHPTMPITRILVVDDKKTDYINYAKFLWAALRRRDTIVVECVNDGEVALDKLKEAGTENPYGLVIGNSRLFEDKAGRATEHIRTLREVHKNQVPIIFVSRKDLTEEQKKRIGNIVHVKKSDRDSLRSVIMPIAGIVNNIVMRSHVHAVSPGAFAAEAAKIAADKIVQLQEEDRNRIVNVVFATGNTMTGFLDALSKDTRIHWPKVGAFHLDSILGLGVDDNSRLDKNSFEGFLQDNLFSKVSIPRENIHFINGREPDLDYARKIVRAGGADIVILGIGPDGHLAYNRPGSSFDSAMRILKDYPDARGSVTLGMKDIFAGRNIFLLANGGVKAKIVQEALEGPITEENPASMLQKHPNLTVILDNAAASRMNVPAQGARLAIKDAIDEFIQKENDVKFLRHLKSSIQIMNVKDLQAIQQSMLDFHREAVGRFKKVLYDAKFLRDAVKALRMMKRGDKDALSDVIDRRIKEIELPFQDTEVGIKAIRPDAPKIRAQIPPAELSQIKHKIRNMIVNVREKTVETALQEALKQLSSGQVNEQKIETAYLSLGEAVDVLKKAAFPSISVRDVENVRNALTVPSGARLAVDMDQTPEDQMEQWVRAVNVKRPILRILVNDDEEQLRRLIPLFLKSSLPNATVEITDKSEDAWEKLQVGAYDLVVTDRNTGSTMTGTQLIDNLRLKEISEGRPVSQQTIAVLYSGDLHNALREKNIQWDNFGPNTFYFSKSERTQTFQLLTTTVHSEGSGARLASNTETIEKIKTLLARYPVSVGGGDGLFKIVVDYAEKPQGDPFKEMVWILRNNLPMYYTFEIREVEYDGQPIAGIAEGHTARKIFMTLDAPFISTGSSGARLAEGQLSVPNPPSKMVKLNAREGLELVKALLKEENKPEGLKAIPTFDLLREPMEFIIFRQGDQVLVQGTGPGDPLHVEQTDVFLVDQTGEVIYFSQALVEAPHNKRLEFFLDNVSEVSKDFLLTGARPASESQGARLAEDDAGIRRFVEVSREIYLDIDRFYRKHKEGMLKGATGVTDYLLDLKAKMREILQTLGQHRKISLKDATPLHLLLAQKDDRLNEKNIAKALSREEKGELWTLTKKIREWGGTLDYLFTISGSLGMMGPNVPRLIADLGSRDPEVHESAAFTLNKMGSAAIPELVQALEDQNPLIRINAAWFLATIRPPVLEEVFELEKLLDDKNGGVRMNAAGAIGKIGEGAHEVLSGLTKALEHEDANVRFTAAEAISFISLRSLASTERFLTSREYIAGLKEALPALIRALNDNNKDVRSWVIRTLGRIGQDAQEVQEVQKAVPALQHTVAHDEDASIREEAERVLKRIQSLSGARLADNQLRVSRAPEAPVMLDAVEGKELIKTLLGPGVGIGQWAMIGFVSDFSRREDPANIRVLNEHGALFIEVTKGSIVLFQPGSNDVFLVYPDRRIVYFPQALLEVKTAEFVQKFAKVKKEDLLSGARLARRPELAIWPGPERSTLRVKIGNKTIVAHDPKGLTEGLDRLKAKGLIPGKFIFDPIDSLYLSIAIRRNGGGVISESSQSVIWSGAESLLRVLNTEKDFKIAKRQSAGARLAVEDVIAAATVLEHVSRFDASDVHKALEVIRINLEAGTDMLAMTSLSRVLAARAVIDYPVFFNRLDLYPHMGRHARGVLIETLNQGDGQARVLAAQSLMQHFEKLRPSEAEHRLAQKVIKASLSRTHVEQIVARAVQVYERSHGVRRFSEAAQEIMKRYLAGEMNIDEAVRRAKKALSKESVWTRLGSSDALEIFVAYKAAVGNALNLKQIDELYAVLNGAYPEVSDRAFQSSLDRLVALIDTKDQKWTRAELETVLRATLEEFKKGKRALGARMAEQTLVGKGNGDQVFAMVDTLLKGRDGTRFQYILVNKIPFNMKGLLVQGRTRPEVAAELRKRLTNLAKLGGDVNVNANLDKQVGLKPDATYEVWTGPVRLDGRYFFGIEIRTSGAHPTLGSYVDKGPASGARMAATQIAAAIARDLRVGEPVLIPIKRDAKTLLIDLFGYEIQGSDGAVLIESRELNAGNLRAYLAGEVGDIESTTFQFTRNELFKFVRAQRAAELYAAVPTLVFPRNRLAQFQVETLPTGFGSFVSGILMKEPALKEILPLRHIANKGLQGPFFGGIDKNFAGMSGSQTGVFAVKSDILFDREGNLEVPDFGQAAQILNQALQIHDVKGNIVIAVYGTGLSAAAKDKIGSALKNISVVAPRIKFIVVGGDDDSIESQGLTKTVQQAILAELEKLKISTDIVSMALAYSLKDRANLGALDGVRYMEVEDAQSGKTYTSAMFVLMALSFGSDFTTQSLPAELRQYLQKLEITVDGKKIVIFLMKPMPVVNAALRLVAAARLATQTSA